MLSRCARFWTKPLQPGQDMGLVSPPITSRRPGRVGCWVELNKATDPEWRYNLQSWGAFWNQRSILFAILNGVLLHGWLIHWYRDTPGTNRNNHLDLWYYKYGVYGILSLSNGDFSYILANLPSSQKGIHLVARAKYVRRPISLSLFLYIFLYIYIYIYIMPNRSIHMIGQIEHVF